MTLERNEALFPKLTRSQIDCLAPHCEEVVFQDGTVLFSEGEHGETFYIVLEGRVRVSKQVAGTEVPIADHEVGEFTGELGVLTGDQALATAVAVGSCRLLRLKASRLPEAIAGCPDILATIVTALAHRRPEALALQNQREKLASLGTMAAGLAHELNNPAAAAARAASQIRTALARQRHYAVELAGLGLSRDEVDTLQETLMSLYGERPAHLDALQKSDRENGILNILQEVEVDHPFEIVGPLVEAGITQEEARRLVKTLPCRGVPSTLGWLSSALAVEQLVSDVEQSTERIRGLVEAVKGYSRLDEAPSKETDIHEGIESTLTMLGYQLRQKSIQLDKRFDRLVPHITAWPGELNQVWTNLLSNAIDAVPFGGTIQVSTQLDGETIVVRVEDNGPGIKPEAMSKVFEPFFTTKPIGEGLGLGLDIAYRIVVDHHRGFMSVASEEGRTVFEVRLPISRHMGMD